MFLPLLFMAGMSGRLFREFGMTISGAVLISAVVALTLTPMLASRLLKARRATARCSRNRASVHGARPQLRGALDAFLRRRFGSAAHSAPVRGVIAAAYTALPRELAPLEDRGRVWVRATAPEGVSYDYMQRYMDDVAAATAERVPEAHVMMTQVPAGGTGAAAGQQRLRAACSSATGRPRANAAGDRGELPRGSPRVHGGARQRDAGSEHGRARSQSSGVEFVLQAPTFEMLREVLPTFVAEAQASPVFTFVDSDLKFNSPEVR